jgi:hypothetical protein
MMHHAIFSRLSLRAIKDSGHEEIHFPLRVIAAPVVSFDEKCCQLVWPSVNCLDVRDVEFAEGR